MTNSNKYFLSIFVILFSINFSQAQPDIGIGEWKSHLPFQAGKYVTQSAEDIIYATNWGIVYINKNDNSTRTLDKLFSVRSLTGSIGSIAPLPNFC